MELQLPLRGQLVKFAACGKRSHPPSRTSVAFFQYVNMYVNGINSDFYSAQTNEG